MIVTDKLLHSLFGHLNSRHQQLSGALWAHIQVADETFDASLVRGCGDDVRAAVEKAVIKKSDIEIVITVCFVPFFSKCELHTRPRDLGMSGVQLTRRYCNLFFRHHSNLTDLR